MWRMTEPARFRGKTTNLQPLSLFFFEPKTVWEKLSLSQIVFLRLYVSGNAHTNTYIHKHAHLINKNNKIDYSIDNIGAWEWVERRQLNIAREKKEGKGEQKVMQFFFS